MRLRRLAAPALTAALLVVGCGNDGTSAADHEANVRSYIADRVAGDDEIQDGCFAILLAGEDAMAGLRRQLIAQIESGEQSNDDPSDDPTPEEREMIDAAVDELGSDRVADITLEEVIDSCLAEEEGA